MARKCKAVRSPKFLVPVYDALAGLETALDAYCESPTADAGKTLMRWQKNLLGALKPFVTLIHRLHSTTYPIRRNRMNDYCRSVPTSISPEEAKAVVYTLTSPLVASAFKTQSLPKPTSDPRTQPPKP